MCHCRAGPTGLTLAISLVSQGYSVMVFEKHSTQLNFSRAMFLNSHSLQLLSKYGLDSKFRRHGQLIRGISIFGISNHKSPLCSCDLSKYTSNPMHPISIAQNDIEKILDSHLNLLGVYVTRSAEYKSHTQDGYGYVICQVELNGSIESFRSRYLFGADGFRSSVREHIGVAMEGETMRNTLMIAADVTVSRFPFQSDLSVWISAKGGIIAIRMSEHSIRLAATHICLAKEMIAVCGDALQSVDWQAEFEIHHYHSIMHGKGPVQLAGDAVHVHSPIGGRGMNMGIADALALSQAVMAGGTFEAYHASRYAETFGWVMKNKVISQLASSQHYLARWIRTLAVWVC